MKIKREQLQQHLRIAAIEYRRCAKEIIEMPHFDLKRKAIDNLLSASNSCDALVCALDVLSVKTVEIES